ncbi:MAG: hypothetical protein J5934_06420 [Succinivibrio sp.]|nr:hypothetical protein [Succinivibrio sp.]
MTDTIKSTQELIDEGYESHRDELETTAELDVQIAFHNHKHVYDDIMQALEKLLYQAYSQGWTDCHTTQYHEITELQNRHSAEMMEMTERLLDRMFAPSEAGVATK